MIERVPLIVAPSSHDRRRLNRASRDGVLPPNSRRGLFFINPFLGAAGGASPGFKTLTFDHTQAGASDTSNFLARIHLTDPALKSIANGGAVGTVNDIRVANDNAASSLNTWKVVLWNAATGEVTIVANIGTMSHTTDPVRYLVYDGASRGSFLGGNPFDSDVKAAISGGDGTTLDITDLSGNSNNGTNSGTACAAAAGPNGLGAIDSIDGASRNIRTANIANYAHATIDLLFMIPVLPSGGARTHIAGIVQTVNGGATAEKNLGINPDGSISWYVYDGTPIHVQSSAGAITAGVWYHLSGRADGTNAKITINGSVNGSLAAGNSYAAYTDPGLQLLGGALGAVHMNDPVGLKVSMVRLSDIARSDDYLLATANAFLNSSFCTVT